jgi:hypothetical protein
MRSFTSGSEERHVNNEDEDTNPPVTLLPPGKVSFPDHFSETQAGSMWYSTAQYITLLNSYPQE